MATASFRRTTIASGSRSIEPSSSKGLEENALIEVRHVKRQLIVLCVSLFATIGSAASASTISISAPAMSHLAVRRPRSGPRSVRWPDAATDIIISVRIQCWRLRPDGDHVIEPRRAALRSRDHGSRNRRLSRRRLAWASPGTPEPLILPRCTLRSWGRATPTS